jgi:hypothetical protein
MPLRRSVFIINKVFAVAGNKSDLYADEKVDEQKAKSFAKEINAVFKYTSAKNASGIDV